MTRTQMLSLLRDPKLVAFVLTAAVMYFGFKIVAPTERFIAIETRVDSLEANTDRMARQMDGLALDRCLQDSVPAAVRYMLGCGFLLQGIRR